MKKLGRLLTAIITEEILEADGVSADVVIEGLTADSRTVVPGGMFVAVRGTAVDGHDYIPKALAAGAVAVVCETIPANHPGDVVWIRVADSSVALGLLASAWFDNPSRHLTLVGVTGTNGKTTIATLLWEAVHALGHRAGLLSTVCNYVDNERIPSTHTTPDPMETNELLRRMVDAGCTFAAMEVSSHGMAQNRTAGLHFAGGIFTNITRDHLDYHKTFREYLRAKQRFFDLLPKTAWALTNIDDPNGTVMTQNTMAAVKTYSLTRTAADFTARIIESHLGSTEMAIAPGVTADITTRFTGRFNAYNLLAVYAALSLLGTPYGEAARVISALVPVAGRFETFHDASGKVSVIVDYAHTPDAITNVLEAVRAVEPRAHVTTVFGAGGNRDHGKRPLMGAAAAAASDRIIITSDNPRDEDPKTIADAVAAGVPVDSPCEVAIILDRIEAINKAVAEAMPGDVVVVAGKGHEDYQVLALGRRIHLDDREIVRGALAAKG